MSSLYCKRLQFQLIRNWTNVGTTNHSGFLVQNTSLIARSFSSVKSVTFDSEKQQKQPSFTVSYLINSCGLSPEIACSLSKKVTFQTPERPDSVLDFLRHNGFTNTHIAKLVKKSPNLLLGNVEETILPKVEYFRSVGISVADLANLVSSNPTILFRSLEKEIIPNYNFLKSLLSHNDKIATVLRRAPFLHDVRRTVGPNISALRVLGVTQSCIVSLITSNPGALCQSSAKFDASVKKVVEMGFSPSAGAFVHALVALTTITEKSWKQKREVFRSWGLSETDFWLAFRRFPRCMTLSVENINAKMDFFVNKMGWQPSDVARGPVVLAYSLEKRIIPRCSVYRVLLVKDLKEKARLSSVLTSTEKYFIDTFVSKYQEQVPQLLNIFQGKIGLLELGIGFDEPSEAKDQL